MTHKDIYTKFMIEYDKANVTSSYPSLTEYEVAAVLDKAYNALIAQKITGNNVRRIGFEMDLKAIEDLAPLIKQKQSVTFSASENAVAPNVLKADLPSDYLYFLDCYLKYTVTPPDNDHKPYDTKTSRIVPTKLVTHAIASKFFTSSFNMPWIKIPVSYIEDGVLYVVYDLLDAPEKTGATIVYIKTPNTFVKDLSTPQEGYVTYFEGTGDAYEFECNSTVAEELISLAVTFALENVESQRLNSKLNMRGLEA